MTYQPYEAAGTQATVPPTGYGMPPCGVPESGNVGQDLGPITPPRGNAPSKMKWAMVIGAAAAATALGVGAAFAVKPAPAPTPQPHVPAIVNRDISSNGSKGGGSSSSGGGGDKYAGTGTSSDNTPAVNTPTNNTPAVNTPADASGAPENSPAPQQTTSVANAEAEYLNEVNSLGGDFNYVSNPVLLGYGTAACADFEDGASVQGTVQDAVNAGADNTDGLDGQDMVEIVIAASSTLCPSYGPAVQAAAQEDSND